VRLERGLPDGVADLPVVFDCAPTWSLRQDGAARWIVRTSSTRARPFWAARLTGGFLESTVYCGNEHTVRRAGRLTLINPVSYPFDQILLMSGLACEGGVVLHGAGLARARNGWAFVGRSGAGKTTLARILDRNGGGRLLSDDRLIVRKARKGFRMYGTPWPGEGRYAVNSGTALRALFFLVKSRRNRIVALRRGEAVQRLLPAVSVPWYDTDLASAVLATCEQLVTDLPAYDLHFTPDRRAADLLARHGAHE